MPAAGFSSQQDWQIIVDVPEFSLNVGAQLALAGESGSGKTTFLNLIAGILKPEAGSIRLDGTLVSELSEARRDRFEIGVEGNGWASKDAQVIFG